MFIQYSMLGFEPTTFRPWVSSHTIPGNNSVRLSITAHFVKKKAYVFTSYYILKLLVANDLTEILPRLKRI